MLHKLNVCIFRELHINESKMDLEMGQGKHTEIMNVSGLPTASVRFGLVNPTTSHTVTGNGNTPINLILSDGSQPNLHFQSERRQRHSRGNNNALHVFACLLIFGLPFPICEFYYSVNSITCQNDVANDALQITLKQWLLVDANFQLVELTLIYFKLRWDSLDLMLIPIWIGNLFGFVWNIVGAFLFWKYLLPTHSCGESLESFMWIRLILGLVTTLKQIGFTNSR